MLSGLEIDIDAEVVGQADGSPAKAEAWHKLWALIDGHSWWPNSAKDAYPNEVDEMMKHDLDTLIALVRMGRPVNGGDPSLGFALAVAALYFKLQKTDHQTVAWARHALIKEINDAQP